MSVRCNDSSRWQVAALAKLARQQGMQDMEALTIDKYQVQCSIAFSVNVLPATTPQANSIQYLAAPSS